MNAEQGERQPQMRFQAVFAARDGEVLARAAREFGIAHSITTYPGEVYVVNGEPNILPKSNMVVEVRHAQADLSGFWNRFWELKQSAESPDEAEGIWLPGSFENPHSPIEIAESADYQKDFGGAVEQPDFFFFRSEESRQELYMIAKNLSEYIAENEVADIIFIDGRARMAYLPMDIYMKMRMPKMVRPNKYFINPHGLKERSAGTLLKLFFGYGALETFSTIGEAKTRAEILGEVKERYRSLLTRRDEPVLLFDTCSHTGETMGTVFDVLEDVGFTDLRFGVASDARRQHDREPDFAALPYEPSMSCNVFGPDYMYKRGSRRAVHSVPSNSWRDRIVAEALREEVREVMEMQLASNA